LNEMALNAFYKNVGFPKVQCESLCVPFCYIVYKEMGSSDGSLAKIEVKRFKMSTPSERTDF
jgi:hypothetical protein